MGNIDADPQLASATHLAPSSPCIGAGNPAHRTGVDIDGETWRIPPSIGADEYVPGASTGALVVAIGVAYTNISPNFPLPLSARVQGRVTGIRWDMGDGTIVSNRAFLRYAWSNAGIYSLRLTAFNDSFPAGLSASVTVRVSNSIYYVNQANPTPRYPYTNWQSAAQTIQDAINAGTLPGRVVLVTNGVYLSGGEQVSNLNTNRVVLKNAVSVRSVNGPAMTLIQGYGPHGITAVRCAYVKQYAVLSGFTLTNGHTWDRPPYADTQEGGGALCEALGVITNCLITGNVAFGDGGAVAGGQIYNCTIYGNWASTGGGAYMSLLTGCKLSENGATNGTGGGARLCTLSNCVVESNSGIWGGGLYGGYASDSCISSNTAKVGGGSCYGELRNCTIVNNTASSGGGVAYGIHHQCRLTDNMAYQGGGSDRGTLVNCTLNRNAASYGGGASGGMLYNCVLNGNRAYDGGGTYGSTNYHCTLTGNCATNSGGGACRSAFYDSIVYHNGAWSGSNYVNSSFIYSCTSPLPTNGVGNIADIPRLASAQHLAANSPCIGRGNAAYSTGVDMDGERWGDPPCMGADEYSAPIIGSLAVAIQAAYTIVATGFAVSVAAQIEGPASGSWWDFGDGTTLSNVPCTSHSWTVPGVYAVTLTAWNDTYLAGVATSVVVHVVEAVHYVDRSNTTPMYPYATWETAATNIQDGIGASSIPGRLIVVTNGVYDAGGVAAQGTLTNRVTLMNAVRLQSVNGPAVTTIVGSAAPGAWRGNGDGAVRCAYVGAIAVLDGFTLTNGHTRTDADYYTAARRQGGGAYLRKQRHDYELHLY